MSYYVYAGHDSLLVRDHLINQSMQWYSTDSEESYKNNKHLLDPVYESKNINYDFNSMGYRSCEFSDVDPDNFFLAMGCSFTEGIGLALEDTWADVFANNMYMDYINLGMGGSGLYTVMHNTLLYVSNLHKYPLPKFVVVQHSQLERDWGVRLMGTQEVIQLETDFKEIPARYLIFDYKNIENLDITMSFKNGVYTDIITNMWNSLGVPVVHWTYIADGVNHISKSKINVFTGNENGQGDVARDNTHDGIKSNRAVADELTTIVEKLLCSESLYERHVPKPNETYLGDGMSNEQDKNVHDTHEGSMGTDRNGPSGTYKSPEELEREEQLKKRIEELRKRDPFIYR